MKSSLGHAWRALTEFSAVPAVAFMDGLAVVSDNPRNVVSPPTKNMAFEWMPLSTYMFSLI